MGKLHNMSLPLVQRDLELPADLPDAVKAFTEILLAPVYKVPVIHVSPVSPDSQDLLRVVIKPVCGCQRERLADLAPEADADVSKHLYKVHCEPDDFRIREFLVHDPLD